MENIKEFLHFCHLLHSKGYVSGSGGNVSQKIGDRIVITPTGRALGLLTEEDLVWIEPDGSFTNGKPSKEVRLHLACYKARPEVTAVVHVHSIYSVAATCREDANIEDAMPHYTPGYAMRVGKLPILPYNTPGSEALAEDVERVLSGRNSVLLKNHGLVTCGKTFEEAFDIMEEVEKNAQLFYLLGGKGDALSEEQENELR